MNERIRELAEQAGFVGESMWPIFGTSQETALNNFAELIVTHATECVRDVLREKDSTLTYKDATMLQQRIQQFFGEQE